MNARDFPVLSTPFSPAGSLSQGLLQGASNSFSLHSVVYKLQIAAGGHNQQLRIQPNILPCYMLECIFSSEKKRVLSTFDRQWSHLTRMYPCDESQGLL